MGRLNTLRTLIVGTALGVASAVIAPRLRHSGGEGDRLSRDVVRRRRASRAVAAFSGAPCAREEETRDRS